MLRQLEVVRGFSAGNHRINQWSHHLRRRHHKHDRLTSNVPGFDPKTCERTKHLRTRLKHRRDLRPHFDPPNAIITGKPEWKGYGFDFGLSKTATCSDGTSKPGCKNSNSNRITPGVFRAQTPPTAPRPNSYTQPFMQGARKGPPNQAPDRAGTKIGH